MTFDIALCAIILLQLSLFLPKWSDANDIFCDKQHAVQLPGNGYIANLNYPFNYTEKQTCVDTILIPPTQYVDWQICFTFRRFQLESLSEPGFGDYLEFPGQLRYCNNGSTAMDFSKSPPSQLPASDPRSNVFYENLCFPIERSNHYSRFTIRFKSVMKPSHLSGDWFGYYADFAIKRAPDLSPLNQQPPSCNGSHPALCGRYCYHGFKDLASSNSSCINSCACNELAVKAPCSSRQFTCFNRQCVSRSVICDGVKDCDDGSDEGYWHARCSGLQNIEACTFEVDSCQFELLGWSKSKSLAEGPTTDNTFKTFYGGSFMITHYPKSDNVTISYSGTPIVRTSSHCMSFWYYFGGGPVGGLFVYIKTADDQTPSLVWRRDYVSSQIRLSWLQGTISLPALAFPIHQVRFEARNGEMMNNVIALDDISLIEGDCYRGDISCTFEVDSCGWTSPSFMNVKSWRRVHKALGSSDHLPLDTDSSNAYFMGCESTSMINSNLFTAELVSPTVSPTSFGMYCLSFNFFLHCGSRDNLTVYTQNVGGTRRQEWSMGCDLVTDWLPANILISTSRDPFQVVIIASLRKYESVHVHFGVDDVVLIPGYCMSPKVALPTASATSSETAGCFGKGQYMCKNGQCISLTLMCNQQYDCMDKSDEGPGCFRSEDVPSTGGGLIKSSGPSHPVVASAVGITLGIVMGLAAMVVSIYCVVRRRFLLRRRRPINGGSAYDYFDHFDFSGGPTSLLPPAYSSAILFDPPKPPPYGETSKPHDEPPKYESFEMMRMESESAHLAGNNASPNEDRVD